MGCNAPAPEDAQGISSDVICGDTLNAEEGMVRSGVEHSFFCRYISVSLFLLQQDLEALSLLAWFFLYDGLLCIAEMAG